MRQDLRETAFTFRLHMGVTRKGEPFLEADVVENVLGDVEHRECMSTAMELARRILETFLNAHFGEAKETLTGDQLKQEVEDDLVSFFDGVTTLDD